MNKLTTAIKNLDLAALKELFVKDPKWKTWAEKDGKNALHYLCGLAIGDNDHKMEQSLQILKFLLKSGIEINSVHRIPERGGYFPGMPLWYAYTRGRNERLYKYLLKTGADPNHCMYAIAWYDDAKAAALFQKFGADINERAGDSTPFFAAFGWRKFKSAEWFLKNGADVNFADNKGNTALFYAVKRKYDSEQIEMLLKYGADANKKSKDGISPKMLAASNRKNILRLFT